MKKKLQRLFIVLILIFTNSIYAQKLETIKGSKMVTLSEIELDSVSSIELFKGVNLILKKGDTYKLNIYADDNLHDVLDIDLNKGKLSLSLMKRIIRKKEFELTLFTPNLNEIILDDNSSLTNNDFFDVSNLNVILNNKAELNCFFNGDIIIFEGNDTSKSKSTFKAESIVYNLKDRSQVINVSNSSITKMNIAGRSHIELSGKSNETFIESFQTSNLKLTNLISEITEIIAEDKTTIYTNTKNDLTISAKDDCKIYIYGKAEIDLIDFKDEATLYKKE